MNKLIALVLIGGAFAAGLLVPDQWRATLQGQNDSANNETNAASAQTAAAPTEAPPNAEADAKTDAVPYTWIERPLQLAAGDTLALSLGLYADAEGGAALARRVATLGFETRYVAVEDATGQIWQMLMAGTFQHATEAERNRAILTEQLRGQATPGIVRAPPPP